MTTPQRINSNFYQIAKTDPVTGNVIGISNVSVTNVNIAGGLPGQVLTTDGAGNLTWGPGGGGGGNIQPLIEWVAPSNIAGQTFNNPNLATFANGLFASVYNNGVLLLANEYTITGTTLTITSHVNVDDVITVGPTGPGGGTVTAVGTTQIDPSGLGFTLTGGTITTSGIVTLNVPNANVLLANLGIPPNIGNVANYPPLSGNGNTVLTGNGTWVAYNLKPYLMATGGSLPPAPIHPPNTTLVFDTVVCNSGGITYSTATGILTLPTAGVYRLVATLQSTVAGDVYSSGDITFVWRHANSDQALIANTQTTADSYGAGSTMIGTQATNELIYVANSAVSVRVATVYPMNNAMNDVNYVRLIAHQL